MSKYALSKAMGAVPDDLLQEAMEVKKKRRTGWTILRAAACLAVVVGLLIAVMSGGREGEIITMPGVVKVYACDAEDVTNRDDMLQYEMQEGIEISQAFYVPVASSSHGIAFTFEVDPSVSQNAEIYLEVTVNGGEFIKKNPEGFSKEDGGNWKSFVRVEEPFQTGETVYWRPRYWSETEELTKIIEHEGGIFADFLIKSGDQLLGYIIIEIEMDTDKNGIDMYYGVLRQRAYFPIENGEHPEISEEYVWKQIAKCHQQDGGRQ